MPNLRNCPRCNRPSDPDHHGHLVFEAQVRCDHCQADDEGLMAGRDFQEWETWADRLCQAFTQVPVHLRRAPEYLPDPQKYWNGHPFLPAQA